MQKEVGERMYTDFLLRYMPCMYMYIIRATACKAKELQCLLG